MSSYQPADLASSTLKRARVDADFTEATPIINRCLECDIDLGADNPRQLCGKTHCMFSIGDEQYDIRATPGNSFPSETEFEDAWHNRRSYRWIHLPVHEIFSVIRIDSNKNLHLKDKYWHEYIIPFNFIPNSIFLDIQSEIGNDLTKSVYVRKGFANVYQIACI